MTRSRTEPPASRWVFPDPREAGPDDVVAVGADLAPGTLLAAYRAGLFPMHLPDGGPLAWWSPVERGIVPLGEFSPSRSLRRSIRRFRTTVDACFESVIAGCADPARPQGWITDEIADAYTTLHRLGFVHSIETWDGDRLVGGLYGVSIGGLFAGESMFHTETDASKVALVRLVEIMRSVEGALLDVQWASDHLISLGAVAVSRADYLERLAHAVAAPVPEPFR